MAARKPKELSYSEKNVLMHARPVKSAPERHYVNNKELVAAIQVHKTRLKTNKHTEVSRPLARMIDSIITNMANSYAFRNYTYLDLMISEARKNCFKYLTNFKPNKKGRKNYPNAYGYFTKVAWGAFVGVIKQEKKHSRIKQKVFDNMPIMDISADQDKLSHLNNEGNHSDVYRNSEYQEEPEVLPTWSPITVTDARGRRRVFKKEKDYLAYVQKHKRTLPQRVKRGWGKGKTK